MSKGTELDSGERRSELAATLLRWRKQQSNQRVRFRKGPLTQEFVARHLGLSQSYLSKIETGKIVPSFLDTELLAAFYGRKLRDLATLRKVDQSRLNHNNFRTGTSGGKSSSQALLTESISSEQVTD